LCIIYICSSGLSVNDKKFYAINVLFIQTGLFGSFLSMDIIAFYIFFESVLIPMYFLVGLKGSGHRAKKAAYIFFLFTLVGSLLFLIAIIGITFEVGSSNFFEVFNYSFTPIKGCFYWWCFFLAFAVKLPLFPFHF
jgi:NADH-quinone oxidoreductase subunit M